MAAKIPRNRPVVAYCRECKAFQLASLWTLTGKDRASCSKCGGRLEQTRNGVPRKLPVGMPDAIDYPKRHSEFEVQAYIFHALRAKGFDVRGEVTTRRGSAILDLVVFEGREPVLIIEVKPARKRISARTKVLVPESTQEQLDGYRRLGIPVQYVPGMSAAVEFCESFELPVVPKG